MTKSHNSSLAAFDFDGTLTDVDSFNDFLIWSFGPRRVFMIFFLYSWAILLYILRLAPNDLPKRFIFSHFFKGMPISEYKALCKNFVNDRLPQIINCTALSRLYWHVNNQHTVIIVSASPSEWLVQWSALHPITTVISTKEETVDGILTGRFISSACYGKQKQRELQKFTKENHINEVYVYGDSRGDAAMLSTANHSYYRDFGLSQNVIITDGQWRKSLAAVRSIGKANHRIAVIGESFFTTSFYSRYTKIRHKKKDNIIQSKSILSEVQHCAAKFQNLGRPVLILMEEKTLISASANRQELSLIADMLIPPVDALEIALDKAKTTEFAKSLNIPTPQTFVPENVDELCDFMQNICLGDLSKYILKPRNGQGSAGIIYQIKSNFDVRSHWENYGNLILQERIPQEGYAIGTSFLLDRNSQLIAKFSHKRLQQYPNSGGPSTDRISIKCKDLEEKALNLLEALGWQGVAMVEWKIDPKTGLAKLLEINPRFWGSLELAIRSGIDFPALYVLAARGKEIGFTPTSIEKIRCRWIIPGDILRYLTMEKGKRETLRSFFKGLPANAEEWDTNDVRGSVASIFCPLILLLSSKRYWHYLNREK